MIKAWINLWKNVFNYTGTATCKEYWRGLIMNVIVMYAGALPCALFAKLIGNPKAVIVLYMVLVHLPAFSVYIRRARGAGWKMGTVAYVTVTMPVISALIVGMITQPIVLSKGQSRIYKLLALGFGLFFYGGVLGSLLYGDPTAIPALPLAGILLVTATLIGNAIMGLKQKLQARSSANKA